MEVLTIIGCFLLVIAIFIGIGIWSSQTEHDKKYADDHDKAMAIYMHDKQVYNRAINELLKRALNKKDIEPKQLAEDLQHIKQVSHDLSHIIFGKEQ